MQLVELNNSTYQYGFIDIKSEEHTVILFFLKNSDGNKNQKLKYI